MNLKKIYIIFLIQKRKFPFLSTVPPRKPVLTITFFNEWVKISWCDNFCQFVKGSPDNFCQVVKRYYAIYLALYHVIFALRRPSCDRANQKTHRPGKRQRRGRKAMKTGQFSRRNNGTRWADRSMNPGITVKRSIHFKFKSRRHHACNLFIGKMTNSLYARSMPDTGCLCGYRVMRQVHLHSYKLWNRRIVHIGDYCVEVTAGGGRMGSLPLAPVNCVAAVKNLTVSQGINSFNRRRQVNHINWLARYSSDRVWNAGQDMALKREGMGLKVVWEREVTGRLPISMGGLMLTVLIDSSIVIRVRYRWK